MNTCASPHLHFETPYGTSSRCASTKALQERVKELEEQLAKKKARKPRKNKSKDLVPKAVEKVTEAEVNEPMRKQLDMENESG
uniref:Uncharacterized protein n=1 Tax=Acrobeloides nanus TaxID=290746 RepID=A0A914CXA2_9BILA